MPLHRALMGTAGAVGVVGGGWFLRRGESGLKLDASSPGARNPTEDADCAALGLPTPAEAQRMPVVRLANFLNKEDVAALCKTAKEMQDTHRVGMVERGPGGERKVSGVWKTSYLHTDGVFQHEFGPLHERVLAAFQEGGGLARGLGPPHGTGPG